MKIVRKQLIWMPAAFMMILLIIAGCAGGGTDKGEPGEAGVVTEPVVEAQDLSQEEQASIDALIAPYAFGSEMPNGWKFSIIEAFSGTDIVLRLESNASEPAILVWLTRRDTGRFSLGKSVSFDINCFVENETGIPEQYEKTVVEIVDLIQANDKGQLNLAKKSADDDGKLDLLSGDVDSEPEDAETGAGDPASQD